MLTYDEERLVPEAFSIADRIFQEHIQRYQYVVRDMQQRQHHPVSVQHILDAPCGEGYGVHMLANQFASATVLGIDISDIAIRHAREKYGSSRRQFQIINMDHVGQVCTLPQDHFQVVTCFEGIEHVNFQEFVAEWLCEVLAPGGVIYVSTPRRDGPGGGSPFHTHELTQEELVALFEPYLKSVSVIGQDIRPGDVLADENARFYLLIGEK